MVVIFSDIKKIGFELIAKARELADKRGKKVCAVVIGKDTGTMAQEYIQRGADKVIVTGSSMEHFNAEDVSDILEKVVREERPDVVLIASTKDGKELAPRLASKLDAGCISDANRIYIEGDSILAERVVYSGNGVAVEQFSTLPGIVTVPGKAFDPLPADPGRTGEIVNRDIELKPQRSRIMDVQEMRSEGVNLEDAEKIVSCGRGFKSSDDIKLIKELAQVLKGNTLGCSRPIAADLKWLSEDHWVGLSGHKVKPKLYVACGISGQIQHVAGMRDSGVIVAINKDADAPIFNSADYGIVGDLYQVLPKLIEAIKQKM
ncbi:MAG: electron transfer flavoprotein subunit alpha/FixB family protein [Candidatus Thermoplasmatota archaeon]|nr:electron transfer flavoprotein subunit alpha/FixB family protein [Candidatus Thermoplasmatota archaeon]